MDLLTVYTQWARLGWAAELDPVMGSVTRAKYKRVTDCLMPCLRAHNISNAHRPLVTSIRDSSVTLITPVTSVAENVTSFMRMNEDDLNDTQR